MSHFLVPFLRAKQACGLQIERTGEWLVTELKAAFDSRTRKQGLLGSEQLPAHQALVIAPTQGVHTFGMQWPLDVVAVARDGRVLKLRAQVPPRRIMLALRAFAFVELAPGAIDRTGLREGDRVVIATSPARHS